MNKGFIFITVLILLTIATIIIAISQNNSSNTYKSIGITKVHSKEFYEVEMAIAKTVAWLQTNSLYFSGTFKDPEFGQKFITNNIPVKGDNDISENSATQDYFHIPTKIKLINTNDSAIISNNSSFGISKFPILNHRDTNVEWNPITNFISAQTGNIDSDPEIDVNVRLTITHAEKSGDEYAPIFRIDAITGNNPDRGVHTYSYITSRLENDLSTSTTEITNLGFYGNNFVNLNSSSNTCVSHAWTLIGSTWQSGTSRSNCNLISDGDINTKAIVSGNAYTNKANGITSTSIPKISGIKCANSGCHNVEFPNVSLQDWNSYCSGVTRDISLTGTNTQTITYSDSSSITDRCWRNINLVGKSTLIFKNTSGISGNSPLPFYVKSLDVGGTSNVKILPYGDEDGTLATKLSNGTIDKNRKVIIYIENFGSQNKINGNTFTNINYSPSNLQINYYGLSNFTYLGNANIRTWLYAPYANITLMGNATWFGCIQSQSIFLQGSPKLDYDEACKITTEVTKKTLLFGMTKLSHRYR